MRCSGRGTAIITPPGPGRCRTAPNNSSLVRPLTYTAIGGPSVFLFTAKGDAVYAGPNDPNGMAANDTFKQLLREGIPLADHGIGVLPGVPRLGLTQGCLGHERAGGGVEADHVPAARLGALLDDDAVPDRGWQGEPVTGGLIGRDEESVQHR